MKILVLAQTPPPVHGQSLMVKAAVDGLPRHGIAVCHVNLALSDTAADIGKTSLRKIARTVGACIRVIASRFTQGCDTLYYIPAPGKRGALYRDWMVMLLCRAFFRRTVFHWHAYGLADWLATHANALERRLTRWLLGRVDLSIVLDDSLRADAEALRPRRIAIVANGIPDPGGMASPSGKNQEPFRVLFLGLCSDEKGLFDAAQGVILANRSAGKEAFTLTAAGAFVDEGTSDRFRSLAAHHAELRHVGVVAGRGKSDLWRGSDVLCFPTRYPPEGQPLVVIEALAHGLPVIASDWKAVPPMLPREGCRIVPLRDPQAIAEALRSVAASPPVAEGLRAHFEQHFTLDAHLSALAAALKGD